MGAAVDVFGQVGKGLGQTADLFGVLAQQVQSHAQGGFFAHSGQGGDLLDGAGKYFGGIVHRDVVLQGINLEKNNVHL